VAAAPPRGRRAGGYLLWIVCSHAHHQVAPPQTTPSSGRRTGSSIQCAFTRSFRTPRPTPDGGGSVEKGPFRTEIGTRGPAPSGLVPTTNSSIKKGPPAADLGSASVTRSAPRSGLHCRFGVASANQRSFLGAGRHSQDAHPQDQCTNGREKSQRQSANSRRCSGRVRAYCPGPGHPDSPFRYKR
jgi:hypothetical protein